MKCIKIHFYKVARLGAHLHKILKSPNNSTIIVNLYS